MVGNQSESASGLVVDIGKYSKLGHRTGDRVGCRGNVAPGDELFSGRCTGFGYSMVGGRRTDGSRPSFLAAEFDLLRVGAKKIYSDFGLKLSMTARSSFR